jgi:hypothetical protein
MSCEIYLIGHNSIKMYYMLNIGLMKLIQIIRISMDLCALVQAAKSILYPGLR